MTAIADRIASLGESRALAHGLALLLGLLCAVLAARLLWLLVAGPTLPLEPSTARDTTATSARAAPLAEYRLFGSGTQPAEVTSRAPASRSGLVLRGTVAAADPALGMAFIAESAAASDRGYRVGDSLPGGVRLREVHPDRVLVERAGNLETLALPRMGEGPEPPRAASADPAARTAASAAADAVHASGGYLSGPISVGRPDLATARQVRAPDLASLVADANIVPVLDGEQVVGVRLRLPDPAVLERLGLSAEDIITAVNGIPLDGPGRRAELEHSLQRGGPVQLTVRRDGIDRQLTIGL
jgi:general secretion pathway protein C